MSRYLVAICLVLLFSLSCCTSQKKNLDTDAKEYCPDAAGLSSESAFLSATSQNTVSREDKDCISDAAKEKSSSDISATVPQVQEYSEEALEKQKQVGDVSPRDLDRNSNDVLKKEEPSDETFVKVCDYIPSARIELRYATDNNFTGKRVYSFKEAYLRYGTVKKLKEVSAQLNERGYLILVWDAYRPVEAQRILWDYFPDPAYVSNPDSGNTSHERGNTVDISIIGIDGSYVEMPTDFDDFSNLADRDYSDCTETAASNAIMLETIMYEVGFRGYFGEWWHYTDLNEYPTEYTFVPQA